MLINVKLSQFLKKKNLFPKIISKLSLLFQHLNSFFMDEYIYIKVFNLGAMSTKLHQRSYIAALFNFACFKSLVDSISASNNVNRIVTHTIQNHTCHRKKPNLMLIKSSIDLDLPKRIHPWDIATVKAKSTVGTGLQQLHPIVGSNKESSRHLPVS